MSSIPNTYDGKRFKKNPYDFYETPLEIAIACLNVLKDNTPFYLDTPVTLDIGCATGVWGKAFKQIYPKSYLVGIDVQNNLDEYSGYYDSYFVGDYLTYDLITKREYDLIIGNPPYSSETNSHLVEDMVLHSLNLLSENGYLGFLLKTEFTASARRYENIFSSHAPLFEYQLVQRPYWTNYKKGSNTIEYSFFIWSKPENIETRKRWLSWK